MARNIFSASSPNLSTIVRLSGRLRTSAVLTITIPTNMEVRKPGKFRPCSDRLRFTISPRLTHKVRLSTEISTRKSQLPSSAALILVVSSTTLAWSRGSGIMPGRRSIRRRAMGPPTRPPATSPKVANASPIALAPVSPACSAAWPQAMAVP